MRQAKVREQEGRQADPRITVERIERKPRRQQWTDFAGAIGPMKKRQRSPALQHDGPGHRPRRERAEDVHGLSVPGDPDRRNENGMWSTAMLRCCSSRESTDLSLLETLP